MAPFQYNSHFAAMYRDKLQADVDGRDWSPADTPASSVEQTSSARKPRDAGVPYDAPVRQASTGPRSTPSPSSMGGAASPYASRKEQNETFFAGLGAANARRPEGVSPAQGGRYVGFGSGSASPAGTTSALPGEGTSSRAVPSFADLQADPGEALKKGWGFLSSTFSQLNASVVEPTASRMTDPALRDEVWSFASRVQSSVISASKTGSAYAAEGLKAASEQARARGYDVGDLGSAGLERYGRKSGDNGGNYAALPTSAAHAGLAPTAYYDSSGGNSPLTPSTAATDGNWSTVAPLTAARNAAAASKAPEPKAEKKPEDEEWESW